MFVSLFLFFLFFITWSLKPGIDVHTTQFFWILNYTTTIVYRDIKLYYPIKVVFVCLIFFSNLVGELTLLQQAVQRPLLKSFSLFSFFMQWLKWWWVFSSQNLGTKTEEKNGIFGFVELREAEAFWDQTISV